MCSISNNSQSQLRSLCNGHVVNLASCLGHTIADQTEMATRYLSDRFQITVEADSVRAILDQHQELRKSKNKEFMRAEKVAQFLSIWFCDLPTTKFTVAGTSSKPSTSNNEYYAESKQGNVSAGLLEPYSVNENSQLKHLCNGHVVSLVSSLGRIEQTTAFLHARFQVKVGVQLLRPIVEQYRRLNKSIKRPMGFEKLKQFCALWFCDLSNTNGGKTACQSDHCTGSDECKMSIGCQNGQEFQDFTMTDTSLARVEKLKMLDPYSVPVHENSKLKSLYNGHIINWALSFGKMTAARAEQTTRFLHKRFGINVEVQSVRSVFEQYKRLNKSSHRFAGSEKLIKFFACLFCNLPIAKACLTDANRKSYATTREHRAKRLEHNVSVGLQFKVNELEFENFELKRQVRKLKLKQWRTQQLLTKWKVEYYRAVACKEASSLAARRLVAKARRFQLNKLKRKTT